MPVDKLQILSFRPETKVWTFDVSFQLINIVGARSSREPSGAMVNRKVWLRNSQQRTAFIGSAQIRG